MHIFKKIFFMIQRIQTLYIMLSALSVLITSIVFPYYKFDLETNHIYLFNEVGGIVWISLFCLFSLIAILKFKNRRGQIYYLNGNLYGIIALIGFICFCHFYSGPIIDGLTYSINFLFIIGFFLGLVFLILAKRAIKRDHELIKSINRIR